MFGRVSAITILGSLLTFGSLAIAQNFGGFGGFNGAGGTGFVTPGVGLTGFGVPGAVGSPYWGWPNTAPLGYQGSGYYPPYGGFAYPGHGYGGFGYGGYPGGAYMGLYSPMARPPRVINNMGGVMSAIQGTTGKSHWRH